MHLIDIAINDIKRLNKVSLLNAYCLNDAKSLYNSLKKYA